MAAETPLPRQHGGFQTPGRRWLGWPAVFVGIWLALIAGFLLAPGSIEEKGLAALHGLCAQQPGHSFYFGDQRLPFDARMTGIYGGFAATCLTLLARGRWRAGRVPPLPIVAALASFVVLLGIDGVNSTLHDLHAPHPYPPHNALRLITGLLTGVSLAVFVWMLVNQVSFRRSDRSRRAPIESFRDLAVLLSVLAGMAGLVLPRWEPLHVPLTFILLASALTVLAGLLLAFILLIARRENQFLDTWQLAGPATVALVGAIVIVGSLAAGRFALEAWLDIEPALRGSG